MDFIPSPQQQVVFDWVERGRGSAFMRARAGCGKTTTLVHSAKRMRGSIALVAFNKKIADEFEVKLAEVGVSSNQLRSGTFHKFGLNAVRQVYPRTQIDAKGKADRLCRELEIPVPLQSFVLKLVSLAKQAAIGLFGKVEDDRCWFDIIDHHDLDTCLENPEQDLTQAILLARKAFARSKEIASEVIDFDDMIFLPATTPMRVWQNDWILVDEAQDTNPARRALARKMLKSGGRAIFVGDDRQGIYGFTGADADAMDQIIRDFACIVLPLTVTRRCPKSVVVEANQIVADIEAHEDAPQGEVSQISLEHLFEADLSSTDAILCRKTAPIVSLAFQLLRRGVACHVEGRDIGAGLLNLVNRWKSRTIGQLTTQLDNYAEREVAKLMAKGRETQAEALQDRVDTLKVLMEGCPDVACVRQKIETMFQDGARTLTLSTVHKSKGREWERVFVLGRHEYMPSPWARQSWQQLQEQNLIYVAVTRSKGRLVYVGA